MSLWVQEGWRPQQTRAATRPDLLRALGFVSCQTCDGSGIGGSFYVDTPKGKTDPALIPCPVCGGLGVRPSDEMIERAARAWVTARKPNKKFEMSRQFRLRARAALLAGIGGQK